MEEIAADANRLASQCLVEKDKANSECARLKTRCKRAEDMEAVLYKENTKLKSELDSKATGATKNTFYESTLESKTKQISSLEANGKRSRTEISGLKAENTKTAALVKSLRDCISRLEREKAESAKAQKTSEGKVSALNASAKEQDERFESLRKDMESKENANAQLRSEKAESDQARKVADDRATALDIDVKERDERIQGLQNDLDSKDSRIGSLEKRLASLEADGKSKDKEVQELSTQVSSSKAKNSESESKITNLSKDITAYKATNDKLEGDVASYQNYVESLETEDQRKDKVIKDFEAQVSALKAKTPKAKGKAKGTKDGESPTARPTDAAHTAGNNDVHARDNATDAGIDVTAPARVGNAAFTAAAKKGPEDEEMPDASEDSPPVAPKGDDSMDIDQNTPPAAGHVGRVTHGAGQPPVAKVPKADFSISNGIRGGSIFPGAATAPNVSSESSKSSAFKFDFGHSTSRVPTGGPGSSIFTGIKPNPDHGATKIPVSASKPTIFDGFKFSLDVPSQTSSFPFGSFNSTPAATEPQVVSSFDRSMRRVGPIPKSSPQIPRTNDRIHRAEGSLCDFGEPADS